MKRRNGKNGMKIEKLIKPISLKRKYEFTKESTVGAA
jgi:hypothetical protein